MSVQIVICVKMGRVLSFIVMAAGIKPKARAARSCEYSATNAWNLNLNNGNASSNRTFMELKCNIERENECPVEF